MRVTGLDPSSVAIGVQVFPLESVNETNGPPAFQSPHRTIVLPQVVVREGVVAVVPLAVEATAVTPRLSATYVPSRVTLGIMSLDSRRARRGQCSRSA